MIRVVIYLLIVAGLACVGGLVRRPPGRGRHHLAGLARRHLGDGAAARSPRSWWPPCCCGRSSARSSARPTRSSRYLQHPPRRARLSGGVARAGRGRLRRRRAPPGSSPTRRGRIAPGEPLTLLLGAQAAQLSGDRASAERAFHVMADRDDTRLLGLHGLYIEAQRRDDPVAARAYAEEAAAHAAPPAWAGQAALEFRCAAGDWTGALERLERNQRAGWSTRRAIGASAPCCSPPARSRPSRPNARAPGPRARGGAARARPGAGRRARRPPAGRGRRAAQGRAHHRGGLEGQPASRSRRGLRPSAARRLARASGSRASRRSREIARQRRGRAGGGARRARRPGVRRRARGARSARDRADASASPR